MKTTQPEKGREVGWFNERLKRMKTVGTKELSSRNVLNASHFQRNVHYHPKHYICHLDRRHCCIYGSEKVRDGEDETLWMIVNVMA